MSDGNSSDATRRNATRRDVTQLRCVGRVGAEHQHLRSRRWRAQRLAERRLVAHTGARTERRRIECGAAMTRDDGRQQCGEQQQCSEATERRRLPRRWRGIHCGKEANRPEISEAHRWRENKKKAREKNKPAHALYSGLQPAEKKQASPAGN